MTCSPRVCGFVVILGVFLIAQVASGSQDECLAAGGCFAKDRSLLQRSVEASSLAASTLEAAKGKDLHKQQAHNESEKPPSEAEVDRSTDTSLCEADKFANPDLCPSTCPYAAEMRDEFCHFRCVKKEECGLLNTVQNATIPDERLKFCRHCEVEGCMQCVASKPGQESLEKCQQCMPGYSLTREGECEMHGVWVFVLIAAVAGVLLVFAIWWYLCVSSKPSVNEAGVQYGLECRARSRISQAGTSETYALSTNLMTTNVAGPGTMALFRFEFAILVWAITLLAVWMGFVYFVSSDLLILGNRPAESPQILCAAIKWGRQRQMELIWTKVSWMAFAYAFSFAGAICYGVQQTKMFARVSAEEEVMTRYVAILEGLPKMKGSEKVEEILKDAVAQACEVEVVGVSVCWDFGEHREEVMHALEDAEEPSEGQAPQQSGMCGLEGSITNKVLNAWHVHLPDEAHGHGQGHADANTKQLLVSLETTSTAYVVFASQQGRDKALETAKASGIQVNGAACTLRSDCYAPEGIMWANFHITEAQRGGRLFTASVNLLLACTAWTVLLYIPYAYYMASFSYANGDEPGEFSEGIFVCLVVASQIGLFVVSSLGAKHAAYQNEDQIQKAYTVMYNAALILNLIMDISLQAVLSYLQMVGVGAHVADGRLLGSLTSFQEIFESYPIQKSVGKLLFKYCWPCTFLVPFLAEPFVAQWLPWQTAKWLVGANPKIKGENAEKAFELGEMEQGRYADCIFNVILVSCIPFIAPAYIHLTFGALIVSHLYIYCFDQTKVLRYARKFNFSGSEVHWLGMQLFAIPISIFAAGLVFKANQMTGTEALGSGYLGGTQLWGAMAGAAIVHAILHLAVLEFFVKGCGAPSSEAKVGHGYATAARLNPATHFSTNPVHCLRSKHILGHSPPQVMFVAGKEHLLQANPKIGAHYMDSSAGGKITK